jgi:hypothetical protein
MAKDDRDAKTGQFLVGHTGNGGRPRGARNRLAGELLEALADDFSQHGIAAVQKVREADPTAYLRIVTGLMPREVIVAALHVSSKNALEELTEARDFAAAYNLARQMIGAEPIIEAEAIEAEAIEIVDTDEND